MAKILFFFLFLLSANTSLAQAGHHELVLTASPNAVAMPSFGSDRRGAGMSGSAFYGFDRHWSAGTILTHQHFYNSEHSYSHNFTGAFVGTGFNIDVLAFIPFFSLSLGALYSHSLREENSFVAAVRNTIGFDHRVVRNWSAGLQFEMYILTNKDFFSSNLSLLSVRFSRILERR